MSTERPDPLAPPEGYGVKPGQQPEPVASSTCTYNSGLCPAQPVVLVKLGCLGEHIAELYFCAPHWADISCHGLAWQCRGIENRGCGNPMRVEAVLMLTADAARRVAAEVAKIRGADQGAIDGALAWANDGRPDTWYRPVWSSPPNHEQSNG